MLGVLNEIRKTGKITSAANDAHLSYRHVWNLIEQWSQFFGVPLIETQRGKGSKLTAFGEKLVWAGERMQARLGPQLENLAQELATEIKPYLEQRPAVIRVHASHGFAVSKLRELLDRDPASAPICAMSAISTRWFRWRRAPAICRAFICRAANCARGRQGCREWLDPRQDRVISFVTREMGLMVKRGNPLKINSLKDIADTKARFVNRDHDFGNASVVRSIADAAQDRPSRIKAPSRSSSLMRRSPPMSQAEWPMSVSASKRPRDSSAWISSAC